MLVKYSCSTKLTFQKTSNVIKLLTIFKNSQPLFHGTKNFY